jgi:hypothetical protein
MARVCKGGLGHRVALGMEYKLDGVSQSGELKEGECERGRTINAMT